MRRRDGRFYLLDFGAVKQVATAPLAGQAGRASTGIYSMGFAPPEQMQGNVVYPATDLYALAVTCLMLLTGKDPSELYDAYSNSWKWRSQLRSAIALPKCLTECCCPLPANAFNQRMMWSAALKPTNSPPPIVPKPVPTPASALSLTHRSHLSLLLSPPASTQLLPRSRLHLHLHPRLNVVLFQR